MRVSDRASCSGALPVTPVCLLGTAAPFPPRAGIGICESDDRRIVLAFGRPATKADWGPSALLCDLQSITLSLFTKSSFGWEAVKAQTDHGRKARATTTIQSSNLDVHGNTGRELGLHPRPSRVFLNDTIRCKCQQLPPPVGAPRRHEVWPL